VSGRLDSRGTGPGVGPVLGLLGPHMERHAEVAFRFLRRHRPVLGGTRFAIVVRDSDVRRVLGSRAQFSVDRYTAKMVEVTGEFALGFDDLHRYRSAQQLIAPALDRSDDVALAKQARDLAAKAMHYAAPRGKLDILGSFLDPVLAQLVGGYLGVTGIPTRALMSWSHTIFTEIFFCPQSHIRPHAFGVVQEFRARIDDLIAARRVKEPKNDVLGRMLDAGVPDDKISGTLLGLFVAWVPNTAKQLALVFDELLDRPSELAAARAATRRLLDRPSGLSAAKAAARREEGRSELLAIIYEAARFRPQGLGIFRTTTSECLVDLDRRGPRTLKAKIPVLACTASAMMDEDAVENPRIFNPARPASNYLHFGYGMHSCAGRRISEATLPELAAALLGHGPVRRARGRSGRLEWRYPYPSHLVVRIG